MSEQEYRLPDLLRDWPWTRRLSPYYLEAKAESRAWVSSFRPFDPTAQKAFDACNLDLLACLTYSTRDKDLARVGCDLMNFFFVYDEYTDIEDAPGANALANTVIRAMKNSEASADNSHFLGEMAQQVLKRASALLNPGSPCQPIEHFVASMEAYVHSVTEEAEDRTHNRVRPLEDYLRLRRLTCGGAPTLGLFEFGLDLPNEVICHPTLVSLTNEGIELLLFVNDMHSYSRESSSGLGDHNLITVIMAEHHLGLQDALNWLGTCTDGLVSRFVSHLRQIPSWDPDTDRKVQMYIDGIGQWVRGQDDWAHEAERYYGDDRLRIREDRILRISQRPNLPWLDLGKENAKGTKGAPVE